MHEGVRTSESERNLPIRQNCGQLADYERVREFLFEFLFHC